MLLCILTFIPLILYSDSVRGLADGGEKNKLKEQENIIRTNPLE